jgi:hypothetical protein
MTLWGLYCGQFPNKKTVEQSGNLTTKAVGSWENILKDINNSGHL